uniref:MARVEL domain-containing protein n=1 Tax=Strongyloides papillosus TaxID=174720 RepID=A0A0N5C3H3_STREA
MNGQNIIINNNNANINTNQQAKKPLKKLLFTTKPEITILVVCILSFLSQIGIFYCFYQIENNGLLIASGGSLITMIISIPFLISGFKKYKFQKHLNLVYIIIQSLFVVACGARLAQYTCYASVFKILGFTGIDPLKNIKIEFFEDEIDEWKSLYIHAVIGATFLAIWMYSIRTVYNLYRRVYIVRVYGNNGQETGGVNKKSKKGDAIPQKMVGNGQNLMGNNFNTQNNFAIPTNAANMPMASGPYNPQVYVK